jgi:hypothetical protein
MEALGVHCKGEVPSAAERAALIERADKQFGHDNYLIVKIRAYDVCERRAVMRLDAVEKTGAAERIAALERRDGIDVEIERSCA